MAHGGEPYLLLTGPLFIGTILNWTLLGTLFIQSYVYYHSNYKDSRWIKGLVLFTLILDIVQTVFVTHSVWGILILGWGNPASFANPPWTSYTFPVMSGVVAALIQTFFAWRVWVLGRNMIAYATAILIVLIGMTQMLAGLVAGIQTAFIPIADVGKLSPQFTVWLAGSLAADVIIVIAMLAMLHKNRSTIGATNRLIDRLTVRVVHTGAVTAIAAAVELILFLIMPETFVHDVPALFLGKLYTNVLLANLNTRRSGDTTYNSHKHISVVHSDSPSDLPMVKFRTGASSGPESTVRASESYNHLNTSGVQVKVVDDVLSDHV
ncbi:hypothetical protein E1B28_009782 [Marasmius oreades]|uniref:DUF6534 domain-containing protein n=1 Tax=Marasmius oreades TaxID=181124 RepID=A0A9P7RVS0_9AGAR|nr:uncharacterized protein E1B28_009782 [Marasmius oreades]KAG7090684.1 hypothetical protein E1B28_009782 [Marasmius oreades]